MKLLKVIGLLVSG